MYTAQQSIRLISFQRKHDASSNFSGKCNVNVNLPVWDPKLTYPFSTKTTTQQLSNEK